MGASNNFASIWASLKLGGQNHLIQIQNKHDPVRIQPFTGDGDVSI
jgi:hypothetical protein